jgi:hypothetical protein
MFFYYNLWHAYSIGLGTFSYQTLIIGVSVALLYYNTNTIIFVINDYVILTMINISERVVG